MISIIGFDKLSVNCIIGCMEEERTKTSHIHISLKVESDVSKAASSDNIEDTISYVHLMDLCKQVATKGKFHLLEKLAHELVNTLFVQYQSIHWVWVKIEKPNVFPEIENMHVEYQKHRQKG